MISINFKDLQNIKNALSENLKNFSGEISQKQKIDETYLKIYKLLQEITLFCKNSKIELKEIENLNLSIDYELSEITALHAENQNLTFNF